MKLVKVYAGQYCRRRSPLCRLSFFNLPLDPGSAREREWFGDMVRVRWVLPLLYFFYVCKFLRKCCVFFHTHLNSQKIDNSFLLTVHQNKFSTFFNTVKTSIAHCSQSLFTQKTSKQQNMQVNTAAAHNQGKGTTTGFVQRMNFPMGINKVYHHYHYI